MKKVYLGMLLLGSAALLAACGGSKPDPAVDYNIKLKGDSVVTEEFKEKNSNLNENYKGAKSFNKKQEKLPTGYSDPGSTASGAGLQVIQRDSDGKFAVYSTLAEKFIIDARLTESNLNSNDDTMFGKVFSYKDSNNKWYIADGRGNLLLEVSEDPSSEMYIQYYEQEYNGRSIVVSMLTYHESGTTKHASFFYKEDGTATRNLNDVLEPTSKKGETPVEEQYRYDLSSYGVNRTVVEYQQGQVGKTYVVYENDGTEAARIEIPADYNAYVFGAKILYQRATYSGTTECEVDTKMYDLDKLTTKDVNFPAVIANFKLLEKVNDKDDLVAAVQVREINDNNTLGSLRTLIIDEDLDARDDITRQNFVFWTKLHNGYYYSSERVLYDTEFKPVVNFSYLNGDFTFDQEFEFFYSRNYDGMYFQSISAEGKTMFDDEFVYGERFSHNDVYFNGVFMCHNAKDTSDSNPYYVDALSGNSFKLESKTTDTLIVSETISGNLIIRTEEKATGGVGTGVKKAIIKSIDGTVIDTQENVQFVFDLYSSAGDGFQQKYLEQNDYHCIGYQFVSGDGTSMIYYTGDFAVNSIPTPNA